MLIDYIGHSFPVQFQIFLCSKSILAKGLQAQASFSLFVFAPWIATLNDGRFISSGKKASPPKIEPKSMG